MSRFSPGECPHHTFDRYIMVANKKTSPIIGFFTRREFILLLRLLLGVVFIWASIHKVQHPEQLAITIRSYEIIPTSLSNLFAISLAWSELFAGIFLIFGVFTKHAAAAVAILLLMFIVAICATMVRGIVINCGCFNEEGHPVDISLLIRNLLLITAAFLVIRFDKGFMSLPLPSRLSQK